MCRIAARDFWLRLGPSKDNEIYFWHLLTDSKRSVIKLFEDCSWLRNFDSNFWGGILERKSSGGENRVVGVWRWGEKWNWGKHLFRILTRKCDSHSVMLNLHVRILSRQKSRRSPGLFSLGPCYSRSKVCDLKWSREIVTFFLFVATFVFYFFIFLQNIF